MFLQYREYTLSELLIVKRIKHTETLCGFTDYLKWTQTNLDLECR